MQKIVVASKNVVKLSATQLGFEKMFPGVPREVIGISAASGVPDQPMGDEETLLGANNRLQIIRQVEPMADYWVAIEGGCGWDGERMSVFAWVVICCADGRVGQSRSATFFVPPKMAELVRGGMELGLADDAIFGRTNSKQQNGTVGMLTGDVIDRVQYYTESVILALIPFKNEALFPELDVI